MQKLRATILGCGSSGGVPRPGGPDGKGDWGACDPDNPKNRRRRCSILVELSQPDGSWEGDLTTVLVDTSPDLREQLLDSGTNRIDAVLLTHDHADQLHGIDDLRPVVIAHRTRIPVHYYPETSPDLLQRFSYCFKQPPNSFYPAILEAKEMTGPGKSFEIEGPTGAFSVTPFLQVHGRIHSLGFVFGEKGGLAYSSDVNELPVESREIIKGVQCWVLDALRYAPHGSHAHVEQSLSWLKEMQVERGILTNLHVDLDYEILAAELPENVQPAYDGLKATIKLP